MLPSADEGLMEKCARILIVEDDEVIRDVLFGLLSPQHECALAASAEEALELMEREPKEFDLVLSDIGMPGMGGLRMVPVIRERAPDTVVVMVSGEGTIHSAVEAMRAGAFDYVMKPFDVDHLQMVVRRALEHRSLLVGRRRREAELEGLVEERTARLDAALHSVEDAYRMTLKALNSALETRDMETHGHSGRVVRFSLRLGRELGLELEALRSLEFGSLLHDIGKIGVPDHILRKPAKLSDEEWRLMKRHTDFGERILGGIQFLEGASRVVAQHHEKWDGSGYPLGLRGEEIDLNARIFAVADAFDAMTSDRVYRQGRPYGVALCELLEHAGEQFDPRVVEAFERVPHEDWEALRVSEERSLAQSA